MTISVVGLGYVGSVLLAGMAHTGHNVIGIGRDKKKLAYFAEGRSPFTEPGLNDLLSEGVKKGRIKVSCSHEEAVVKSDITFVCVGTPSAKDGGLEMEQTMVAAKQIGNALRKCKKFHTVCFRSTLFAGSTEDTLIPILESTSGKKCNKDFGVCYNPEFLREGVAVEDFFNPPFTVIGSSNNKAANIISKAYGYKKEKSATIKAPLLLCKIKEAEALKYSCNVFHALKIVFANEVASVYSRYHIDPQRVFDMFLRDTKLNISTKYMRPGNPYGGSCLGKDLRVLITQANVTSTDVPLLTSVSKSNEAHIERIYNDIIALGYKKIGILGLAFKEDTDDLRESPPLLLVKKLISSGFDIKIYDPFVSQLKKRGLLNTLSDPKSLIVDQFIDDANSFLNSSSLIVITNKTFVKILDKLKKNYKVYSIYDCTDSRLSLPKNLNIEYNSPFV